MMDRKNNLYDKALEFSREIVLIYRKLDNGATEKEILRQMLRSGTAIGANIAEAQGSISEADYISKIHIAYKELLETRYWSELLMMTLDITNLEFEEIDSRLEELSKILYTIIKNIRSKKQYK